MTITETRAPEPSTDPCPSWCTFDHGADLDDGIHTTDPLGVDLSTRQANGRLGYVLVGVQQHPEGDPFVAVTHHDERADSEDRLTPESAAVLAGHLRDLASIIRACGDNTCWCNGLHTPGESCCGEIQNIDANGGASMTLAIVREWHGKITRVELSSGRKGTTYDWFTADEAEELAGKLLKLVAVLRSAEASR